MQTRFIPLLSPKYTRSHQESLFRKHVGFPTRKIFGYSPNIWDFVSRDSIDCLIHEYMSLYLRDSSNPVFFSNEGISHNAVFPFFSNHKQEHRKRDPAFLAAHLKKLQQIVKSCNFDNLKVIVVFRRQDEWFASLYSRYASLMLLPSQRDFEKQVRQLTDSRSRRFDEGAWGDFLYLYQCLEQELGSDNILFRPLELLTFQEEKFICELMDFLELDDAVQEEIVQGFNKKDPSLVHSQKRTPSTNRWQLRRNVDIGNYLPWPTRFNRFWLGEIELPQSLSEEILHCYRERNQALSRALHLDLSRYGYF